MKNIDLQEIAVGIPKLTGLLLVTLPDCLPYQAWTATDTEDGAEEAAAHLGILVRTVRERAAARWPAATIKQITLEMAESLVLLRDVDEGFGLVCQFDASLPIGMARVLAAETAAGVRAWAWRNLESWGGSATMDDTP
ncbi:MAG: hypothetical protein GXP47_13190 [Acidobacteria bacterium]|nr:hypothetical protein [Acidobacteriota bacterium]